MELSDYLQPEYKFLYRAKAIKLEIEKVFGPPEQGMKADGPALISETLFKKAPEYLKRVVNQINGTYSKGWFDATAVIVRRMLETLIIEAFEHHKISQNIQKTNGDFFYLGDLVSNILTEPTWNLSKNAKKALPKLKNIGNNSAHCRRFNAIKPDLLDLKDDLRIVIEELLVLANHR